MRVIKHPADPGGFTLIEMALVITIMGILLVPLLMAYNTQLVAQKRQTTWKNMDSIRQSLAEYVLSQHHFPCPAPLNLAPGGSTSNTKYGTGYCNLTGAPVLPGSCDTVAGWCRGISGDAFHGIAPTKYVDPTKVDTYLIGAIPINDLLAADAGGQAILQNNKPSDSQTVDAWNNKILYAVTESMTDPATYQPSHGVIIILDENGRAVLDPPTSAHFILMSFGDDGVGANNHQGGVGTPCTVGEVQSPNCNQPYNNTSSFVNALRSDAPGAGHSDDMVMYFTSNSSSIWAASSTSPGSIYDTNPGNVGVATKNPTNTLDINGNFKAINTHAQLLCDAAGQNCYDPTLVGGTGMGCGTAGTAVNAIGARTGAGAHGVDVECDPIITTPVNRTCGGGQYMAGYDSATGPICCSLTGGGDPGCP